MTSRKLKHYFQAHPIEVKTGFALGDIVSNREVTGQVAKWAVELGQYEISFSPRTAIKGQALADFFSEWLETQIPPEVKNLEYWEMYFDGSLQLQGAGAGVVLLTPQKEVFKYVLQMNFKASNNAAEYEALLHGLRVAASLGVQRLDVYGDSALIINQVNKTWQCHDDSMAAYRQEVRKLEEKFDGLQISTCCATRIPQPTSWPS